MSCFGCGQPLADLMGITGNQVLCEACARDRGLELYRTPSELLQPLSASAPLAFRFPSLSELWDVPLVRLIGMGLGARLLYQLLSSESEPLQARTKVYTGETNRPDRRPLEHQRLGKTFTRVAFYGPMTKSAAREMQAERLAIYRRRHSGANPKYNLTLHG